MMSIASLLNVFKVFRGEELSPEERKHLVQEALLLTLARASSSDSRIESIEVSAVQRAIKEAIDIDVSEADVRVAAKSELFETVSLETALRRLSDRLSDEDRMLVVRKLEDVIRSDSRVSEFELDYFDRVVRALRVPPSMLSELTLKR
jgi:uncharacterized tellurite resistance protein B-like protein